MEARYWQSSLGWHFLRTLCWSLHIQPLLPSTALQVLHAAGVQRPRAVVVAYSARQRAVTAVEALREAYPEAPIYARAVDMKHAAELEAAGVEGVAV